jgi:predicted 2-oxoglutarate/Fe(II)-dependent dioxygenase YbiX/peroxiredoxin
LHGESPQTCARTFAKPLLTQKDQQERDAMASMHPDLKGLRYRVLLPGDPAPAVTVRCTSNERYHLDLAAGRYLVLAFIGTTADPRCRALTEIASRYRRLFDEDKVALFFVSIDPNDERNDRLRESIPGIRVFWDFDQTVCRDYGAAPVNGQPGKSAPFMVKWVIIDPNMRVRSVIAGDSATDIDAIAREIAALPPVDLYCGFAVAAPILVIPRVFEPDLCADLIARYESMGNVDSGYMSERNGMTVSRMDYAHKRRRDHIIEDVELQTLLQAKIKRRIVPEIAKVHQFHVTRMERYIVACYDGEEGGHFRAHRDNTTKGTAHRRFAVSINLNADFDGGNISFPEYGSTQYRPPAGGAVVFSCSLLHAVSRVTRGKRFAFLPFLYDDAAAEIRVRNNAFLDPAVGAYSPAPTASS